VTPTPPPRPALGGAGPFAPGDLALMHDRSGRRYPVVLRPGLKQSLHHGAFSHDELIGRPEGTLVTTQRGSRLVALRPTFAEYLVERRRRAQVQPIYPKDLGAILVRADVGPGARVVEAGTGTAALTMALVRAVGPEGHVVSYEARHEFHEAAREMIEEAMGGVPRTLSLKVGDVYAGIDEREVDRVMLDLPEPWLAVPHAAAALLPGGVLFAHCPNVTQVQRLCDALRDRGGFGLIETVEVLERRWTARGRTLRPAHRMVAHTGFLTFARRLAGTGVFEVTDEGMR
jgi:tRNA (adenine57-N1/adenine58-N1)-methyltransferase catalytic subunit